MKVSFFGSLLVLSVLSTACSSSSDHAAANPFANGGTSSKTESLSYEYEVNGCQTGKQTFSSQADLCRGLENENLNNHCALELRSAEFQRSCPGQTFKPFEGQSAVADDAHILQITALNFLAGGFEPCDVKNKIFAFSSTDNNLEVSICENSKVKVFAISHSGSVTFHAIDLSTTSELADASSGISQSFELGKTQDRIRIQFQNPYGFSYVMAEEVTGIDPELLQQFNQLNGKAADLRAQILTAQQQGKPAPAKAVKELADLDVQLAILEQKMQKTN